MRRRGADEITLQQMRMTAQQEVQNFVLRLLNELKAEEDIDGRFWILTVRALNKYSEECV